MPSRFCASPCVEEEADSPKVIASLPSSGDYGSCGGANGTKSIGSFREVTAVPPRPETKSLLAPPSSRFSKKRLLGKNAKGFAEDEVSTMPSANRVLSSLIAMLQGVEVLCNLAILYLYKDDFKLDPAVMGVVMGALKVPWTVKPVWAMLSDNLPLFGYRRKSYIFLGSFFCVCGTVGMGLIGCTNIWLATSFLFLYFVGSAMCNVIGEALVVEAGRKDASEEGTAKTVSAFFAFRKLSFAIMSYLSGLLLDYMDKRYVFLLATALPLAVFLANFFLVEPFTEVLPLREQLRRLMRVVRRPALLHSTLFIFIMMSTPSAGSIMFFFMTNELKFGPELLGRMALFQSIASLVGILTYMWFFSTTSLRKLLLVSTIVVTPFCLLPIVVVQRWNVLIGIPDTAFVVTDTVLMEFVGEFQAMPILVLAARLCPPGLESTIYSFLLSAYNLGLGLGSLISAGLTAAYGISATNFTNLSSLIVVCAATNLIPLLLIWMVPDRIPAIETAELIDPFAMTPTALSDAEDDEDSLEASTRASSDVEKGSTRNRKARGLPTDSDSTDSENRSLASGPFSAGSSERNCGGAASDEETGDCGALAPDAVVAAAMECGGSGECVPRLRSHKDL
ncbi:putative integral membrane protein [Besnoitia besnoiti]|uniref:Putative integral membrane protein n=1 Tax=Besnoitia besnoiti TaxID=94643 RepID=A0A2A9MFH9_BESBE|nr:putative integral membrane protein [Besnoitia besnoiti]PFH35954.1 putative integral membrane protein [Besnoitia besnoiti]